MKTILTSLALLFTGLCSHAATNIDGTNASAYGANIGWVNMRGDVTNGAVVSEFICSGFIYSANCGWINIGGGAPANGIRYLNNSAADFGVNTQDYSSNGTICEAKLRGFAYGANIGWINFEATGDPRVNLSTGKFRGYAYGANIGWINLGELDANVNVVTTSIAPGTDTDGDGIPDAWERLKVGNLTTMNATSDTDGDGVPDKDEYAADTDPLDRSDKLQITAIVPPRQLVAAGPFVTDLTWTSKPTRKYTIEISPDLIVAFTSALTNIAPGSGTTTLKSFNDVSALKRFYRVRAKLPLAP